MTTQLDTLMEKLRGVEAEIEVELTKRREELRFHFENRRIVFEQEVAAAPPGDQDAAVALSHRGQSADGADRSGDLFVDRPDRAARSLRHGVSGDLLSRCTGFQKCAAATIWCSTAIISPISTSIEKFNCAYCSYANGAIAFVREVASRTEVYWCPIKHARRVLGSAPALSGFADFGDAEGYRAKIRQLEDGVKIEGAS